jgi:hypothetical protein
MPHLGARSMDSVVYDSIRCGVRNGGYRGSDQGESGGYSSQFSVPSQILNQRIVEVYDGFEEDADRPGVAVEPQSLNHRGHRGGHRGTGETLDCEAWWLNRQTPGAGKKMRG